MNYDELLNVFFNLALGMATNCLSVSLSTDLIQTEIQYVNKH